MTTSAASYTPSTAPSPDAIPRATIRVVAAVLGFSTITIFTRLALREGATLPSVLFLRYTLSLVPLILVAGWPSIRSVPRRRAIELTVIGGGMQSAVAWLTLTALEYIPAATLVFLFYTFPAWVTIFAAIRRTEPITPSRVLALLLALTGIALTVGIRSAMTIHPAGVALALAASVLYAAFLPIIRTVQADVSSATATAFIALGATLIFLVGATTTGTLSLALSPLSWTWIVLLAFFGTALPFALFLSGLRTLGPVRTAIAATIEPFFVAVLAAVVLDQPLTPGILIGGSCIVGAVILLQLRPARGP